MYLREQTTSSNVSIIAITIAPLILIFRVTPVSFVIMELVVDVADNPVEYDGLSCGGAAPDVQTHEFNDMTSGILEPSSKPVVD